MRVTVVTCSSNSPLEGRVTAVAMSGDAVAKPRSARSIWMVSVSALVLGTLFNPLMSTTVHAESLRQALASTYKSNPRLDAERARLRASDEEVPRALSGYRPNITATADTGFSRTDTKPVGTTTGETHPHGVGVNFIQPLFRGFRTVNTVRQAEATLRAARENLRIIEQSVLLEAVTAYMDVVRDQSLVRLRENNVNVLSRELKATQDRFAVGEVTRTDVAQAEAQRAASVAALDLAKANLKVSGANYQRTVGAVPTNVVPPKVPEKLLPKSQPEVQSITNQEGPTIIQAQYQEQAARHNVDTIWGELLPTLQLEGSYAKRYEPSRALDESQTTSLIGRLNVPIYAQGEVHARLRQAKHTHVSRMQEIERVRTEAVAIATGAYAQLVAVRARLVSDKIGVEASQTALNGVREEEKVGQRTLLDVLNAEQTLLNAQVTLVTDQRDLIVQSYVVLQAVGRLNNEYLELESAAYDPEAHYFEIRKNWFGISITHGDGRREFIDNWDTQSRADPLLR
jgi:outer membrane protein